MKKAKRITALSASLAAVIAFGACSSREKIQPYDPATRTPTDVNETVVVPDESAYEYYNNYIELYDGDGDVYDIGDPFVFRHDGKFYLYTSLNGDKKNLGKIPCWVSENLVDWEWGGWAYDPHKSGQSETYIAFAPEVVYYKGWFYMCESQRGNGHYFFRSASPTGPFEQISDNLGMGIDGSFHLAQDGKLYFLSANNDLTNRICWFDLDFVEENGVCRAVIDRYKPHILYDAYLDGWTEGPGVFARNGYEYLTYTGNHVDSANYHEAWSYAKGTIAFDAYAESAGEQNLASKWENNTLIATGIDTPAVAGYGGSGNTAVTDYRGLGHSSNVVGPNLDSIFTAYHIAGRNNHKNVNDNTGGTRKYNVTQYFTNEGYVLTNGLGNYNRIKPLSPDYSAGPADLSSENGLALSAKSTEAIFTAELNFRFTGERATLVAGYQSSSSFAEITTDGRTLTLKNGGSTLGQGSVPTSTRSDAVHTVKLVNGATALQVWYDNVLVFTSSPLAAGKVGYGANADPSSTEFTNDAFGTSDFETAKELTGSFPAYTYMKGENRGWSIKDAAVRSDGLRQGEPESTKTVAADAIRGQLEYENGELKGESDASRLPATAVALNAGDWVKYLVYSPREDAYGLEMLVGKESAGCVFEIIIDNQTITKMEVPSAEFFGNTEYVNLSTGSFKCGAGLHTMKVRVYSGTLSVVNFSTVKNGAGEDVEDALVNAANSVFKNDLGTNYSFTQNGLMTNVADAKTLFLTGNKGASNFELTVKVSVPRGSSGGILFRMNNYSYVNAKTVSQEGWQGYYLALNPSFVSLSKRNHNREQALWLGRSQASFANGTKVAVTIRCENGKITVSFDGVQAVELYDPEAYLDGYIGLYAEQDTIMIFSDYTYKAL